jgi:hypothetical protein
VLLEDLVLSGVDAVAEVFTVCRMPTTSQSTRPGAGQFQTSLTMTAEAHQRIDRISRQFRGLPKRRVVELLLDAWDTLTPERRIELVMGGTAADAGTAEGAA